MLTSLCLSANIHSQMRLNTHTLTITIIPYCHGCRQCVWSRKTPPLSLSVFAPLPLFSTPLLCFSSFSFPLLFVQSLSVSVMMNQGEAVIGTALWLCYCQRSLSASSLSPLPSLLPLLPPSLARSLSSLSNSCHKTFSANAKSWPKRDVGQGQVENEVAWVFLCVFGANHLNLTHTHICSSRSASDLPLHTCGYFMPKEKVESSVAHWEPNKNSAHVWRNQQTPTLFVVIILVLGIKSGRLTSVLTKWVN